MKIQVDNSKTFEVRAYYEIPAKLCAATVYLKS